MLMNINCSAVTSIKVNLTFDDGRSKECIVSVGDLVDVEYNANGLRKRVEGKVVKVSAVGTDPNGWCIIVDGSDDFDSNKARFAPTAILDIDVIRKADSLDVVQTPLGHDGVQYLRIVKGRLQYSHNGFDWHFVRFGREDMIEDAEGTYPYVPPIEPEPNRKPERPHHHRSEYDDNYDNEEDYENEEVSFDEYDDDVIEESNY